MVKLLVSILKILGAKTQTPMDHSCLSGRSRRHSRRSIEANSSNPTATPAVNRWRRKSLESRWAQESFRRKGSSDPHEVVLLMASRERCLDEEGIKMEFCPAEQGTGPQHARTTRSSREECRST